MGFLVNMPSLECSRVMGKKGRDTLQRTDRAIPGSRDQQVAVLLGKQTLPVE